MDSFDKYVLAGQPRTDTERFYFKDQELAPEFAKTLESLGVKIYSQRDDDWFWDTWRERA